MASNTLTKIGKYDVVDVLGKGGMGIVYKAMDNRIGRLVAIKMMTGGFAENPDLLKRFYREAQSTGMLQHPNIVIIYDLGDQDGNPYLVMEYLEGEALDKIIASRREVSVVEKLGILIQACNGLNYAHQRGIVHRDVKPANIMVLRDNSVKIVDFGIARLGDTSLTRTGQVVGTITYMSPEQINAQVVDGRSDIFSAGVVLYEMLTYTLPFEGKDTASTLLKIIHEPPPPLKNYLSNYPPELDDVIARALAKDREERYATAEDFAFDVSRVQEQMKRHMVSDYVERARASMEKQELTRAKELLQQVLRVDTQHGMAKDLMHEVQQRLQRQQRGEQIRQLRSHAEDALAQKLFEDALSYLDQALTLDKTSTELLNLRDMAQEAKTRKDKIDNALRRAESAQLSGDLEAAQKSAEDALALDAEHSQARALHASITKEVGEKSKQRKLQVFLEEARRNISSRRFTDAFEVLKKAESLDSTSPEVHALMNLAGSGREQETRRRELERFTGEIEDALNRDDYQAACEKAEQALQKFSNDPGLLKLKAMADKQRETGEKRRFVEEQMAMARKLLDSGQAAEALSALEKASQKAPADSRLHSLLAIVRESAEREKAERLKDEYTHRAKDALRRKDYDAAVKILEEGHAEIESSAEIADLLQFAKDEAASHAKRRKVDLAAEEAQRLIADEEYDRAVALLEATMKDFPDEELRVVLTDARRHVEEFDRKVEAAVAKAQRLLDARRVEEAVTFLEAQPKIYARSTEFCTVLEKARGEHDQVRAVGSAVAQARAAMEKGEFAAAMNIVEACRKSYGETVEVKKALADIESRRAAVAKTSVEKAVRDARTLLLARQYAATLKTLEAVAALVSAAPADLQKQYEGLKNDATGGASRQKKEADLGKTIVAGSAAAGQTMVAGSAEAAQTQMAGADSGATVVMGSSAASGKFPAAAPVPPVGLPVPAPAPARKVPAAVPAPVAVPAPAVARKSPVVLIAGAAVLLLVLAVGGYIAYTRMAGPLPATAYIEINAVPWGTVKSVTAVEGKFKAAVEQQTPLRVMVPPGEYNVVVTGPNGQEKTEIVKTNNDLPGQVTPVFEAIDVDKLITTH